MIYVYLFTHLFFYLFIHYNIFVFVSINIVINSLYLLNEYINETKTKTYDNRLLNIISYCKNTYTFLYNQINDRIYSKYIKNNNTPSNNVYYNNFKLYYQLLLNDLINFVQLIGYLTQKQMLKTAISVMMSTSPINRISAMTMPMPMAMHMPINPIASQSMLNLINKSTNNELLYDSDNDKLD